MRNDAIEEIVSSVRAESPAPETLDRIRKTLVAGIAPVRPLPSDRTLIAIVFACVVLFSIAATVPFGFLAAQSLTAYQTFLLYPTLAACASFCASAVVGQMIPGSSRNRQPSVPILCSLILLMAVTLTIFRDFGLTGFVDRGVPCLRLGTAMAVIAFCLICGFLRKGLVTSWLRAGALGGGLAGLTGVSVLALHCPIQNAPHVLVWHLGVIVAAGFGGLLFGWIRD